MFVHGRETRDHLVLIPAETMRLSSSTEDTVQSKYAIGWSAPSRGEGFPI